MEKMSGAIFYMSKKVSHKFFNFIGILAGDFLKPNPISPIRVGPFRRDQSENFRLLLWILVRFFHCVGLCNLSVRTKMWLVRRFSCK